MKGTEVFAASISKILFCVSVQMKGCSFKGTVVSPVSALKGNEVL